MENPLTRARPHVERPDVPRRSGRRPFAHDRAENHQIVVDDAGRGSRHGHEEDIAVEPYLTVRETLARAYFRTGRFSVWDHDLDGPMRRGAADDELIQFIRGVVDRKEARHHIGEKDFVPASRTMVHIGG